MRKILVYILLFVSVGAFAQQDPQYNQYMFNPLIANPAYAGSRDAISTVILHRSQWVGIEGAPQTQTLTVHGPVAMRKVGLGFSVVNDRMGPSGSTEISGVYAYRLQLGTGKIAFGLRTSAYNYRFNWDQIDYKDKTEDLLQANVNKWAPSFDFGMMYYDRKTYVGLGLNHLNNPKYKLGNLSDTSSTKYTSSISRHLVLTAGHAYEITREWVFKPSLFARATEGRSAVLDINASFLYKNILWLGATIRSTKGLVFIVEYNINSFFRAGYSFDVAFNTLQRYNAGSHEIFIGYDIPLRKRKILSPRYF